MLGIGYIKNDGPTSLSKMTTRDHVFLAERLGGTGTARGIYNTGTALGICITGTDRFGSLTTPIREEISMILPPRTYGGTPADLLGISNIII